MHVFADLPNDSIYAGRIARRDLDAASNTSTMTETLALGGKVSLFAIDGAGPILAVEVRQVSTISTDDFAAMPEGALIPEPMDLAIINHLVEHGAPFAKAAPVEAPKADGSARAEDKAEG